MAGAAEPEETPLSGARLYALAALGGAVVANAYYIHPIIAEVARDFGVGEARIGLVPALNQLALAIGIILLLPLGDVLGNRRLVAIFSVLQAAALAAMTVAGNFELFLLASTALGFVTIAPYIIPAYASRRVPPERLGHVTAILTAGVIFGILVARVGAGVVAEYADWRWIYAFATAAMLLAVATLRWTMDPPRPRADAPGYLQTLRSLPRLALAYPQTLWAGTIQGLNFAMFIAIWLALALHLTSPQMGYGTDAVGYLAGFGLVSLVATPRLGGLADRFGPARARLWFAAIQMAGIALLWPFGTSIWLLMVAIFLLNLVGPSIDVTGRMEVLAAPPDTRNRLMTVYIAIMFAGGGLGGALGTMVYAAFGWGGTAAALFGTSALLATLAWWRAR